MDASTGAGGFMRAIQMPVFGDADVLKYVDLPLPEPGPGELLIRLHAAGVNPADTYIRPMWTS
jgi:NADPH:quinone reductase-like Zn-dependent oxidoreductase